MEDTIVIVRSYYVFMTRLWRTPGPPIELSRQRIASHPKTTSTAQGKHDVYGAKQRWSVGCHDRSRSVRKDLRVGMGTLLISFRAMISQRFLFRRAAVTHFTTIFEDAPQVAILARHLIRATFAAMERNSSRGRTKNARRCWPATRPIRRRWRRRRRPHKSPRRRRRRRRRQPRRRRRQPRRR